MSQNHSSASEYESIAESAERVLDAFGQPITTDASQRIYAAGDLNITGDAAVIEIIYRGTLVFRSPPARGSDSYTFIEGEWIDEIRRLAQGAITEPPSSGEEPRLEAQPEKHQK